MILQLDDTFHRETRLAWLKELAPAWDGYSNAMLFDFILANPFVLDCEPTQITSVPLTVKANCDGPILFDAPSYGWPRFGAFGRWDNTFVDHISAARWYRVEHGELSHVAPCEVTL